MIVAADNQREADAKPQRAPYLTPAEQLSSQLRAMVRAGEKLPPLQKEHLQEELENIYAAVRNLRKRYELLTGQTIVVEEPYDGSKD